MILCPWKDIERYEALIPGLAEAIEKINALKDPEPGTYPLTNGKFMVQHGTTKPLAEGKLEAHKEYLDIQYVFEGREVCGWAPTYEVTPAEPWNDEKDVGLFTGENLPITIDAGMCYVLYPEDAHAPCKHLDVPTDYKKIVVKLKL